MNDSNCLWLAPAVSVNADNGKWFEDRRMSQQAREG